MEVRPYQNKDYFDVREICTQTATGVYKEKPYLARLLFCDYYITHEPDNCFVAVNDEDKAIGYIISTSNPKKYKKYTFNALATLKNSEKGHYFQQKISIVLEGLVNIFYPAHLHIDILDGYQRMGLGKKLMDLLVENLKNKNIKGVHLGVSKDNVKGNSFYKKYGFKKLLSIGGSTLYGLKLR